MACGAISGARRERPAYCDARAIVRQILGEYGSQRGTRRRAPRAADVQCSGGRLPAAPPRPLCANTKPAGQQAGLSVKDDTKPDTKPAADSEPARPRTWRSRGPWRCMASRGAPGNRESGRGLPMLAAFWIMIDLTMEDLTAVGA